MRITAVAGELLQVFSNLISNSLDAICERGVIKLRVSAHNDHARVTVADNGKGIPPSIRQHIFEPFFTTKEPGKGTGLGLATVYGTVKRSNGDIWVHSEPDRGTVFKLYFPKFTAEEAPN